MVMIIMGIIEIIKAQMSEEEKDLLEEEEFKEIIIWDIIMLEKEMKIIKNLRIK